MRVTLRFFARFGELLGNSREIDISEGTSLADLVREVARTSSEGYQAIFDEAGSFHRYVILMRNRKRIRPEDAETMLVADGDEIAVFPPVAGG
ncbi:MAG TPA: MoaD/ThiS family protein [Methanoregulaceae archaeon]|jgi:molybdopterin synthase sulfur carrier subunit|nr:MoaD/ThiS family protein [Methanoregulaceae archaeon]